MNNDKDFNYNRMTLENTERCIHRYLPFYECPEGCTQPDYQVLPPRYEYNDDDSFLREEGGIVLEPLS